MGAVVRKLKKPIKKVVDVKKKILKSPLGKAALLAGGAYFVAPSLFAGGAGLGSLTTATGRQVFLQEALKRAAINAAAQGLTGGKVDLKSALVSGGVGAFVPTVGPISGIENQVLREAAIGGITSLGTQAALGRDIDLGQAAVAGGLSGGLQGLQNVRADRTFFGGDPTTTPTPFTPETRVVPGSGVVETSGDPAFQTVPDVATRGAFADVEFDPPAGGVGFEPIQGKLGQTAQTRITPVEPGAAGEVVEGAIVKPTIGERLSGVGEGIRGIFEKDATIKDRTASALSSLKELTGAAADRPILSTVALGTLVASANAPQEEDETDQEFKKRKSNVSKYLRQYGSKFYSGDELDDFVDSYLTEYAKGGVVSLNTPRDMYLEFGKVYLEEGGRPEDMVSFTDFPSGVIYMDPEGNPISKEEFLRRTMEAEEEEKRQIKEQLDIDEDKEAPSIKKAEGGMAEKTPSSKEQREEDYILGLYKIRDIQKKLPNRDLSEDFPGVTNDVLASFLSKRERGMPMKQIQTDLIQTYGAANYSRFMNTLKKQGLGDFKTTGKTPRNPMEELDAIKKAEGGMADIDENEFMQYMKNFPNPSLKDFKLRKKQNPDFLTPDRSRAAEGGIAEIDLREKGGFVPMGKKEKADDVPAMLSKNEFVLTADAVRGIGDGNVEKGAQRLYDLMGEAEKVGRGVA
jgi:hypothetical protein